MDTIEIKKGAKYTVVSESGDGKSMATEGEYIGYAILGEGGSLIFKINDNNKNKLRLIPVSSIAYIDFDEENIVAKDKDSDRDKTTYIV